MTTQAKTASAVAQEKSQQALAGAASKGKPKSPPAPSRSLREAFADVQKLYDIYGRAEFGRAELASTLGISSTAGPTAGRIFTYKEFGLIQQSGDGFKVSE